MLRAFINPHHDDWDKYLPSAEFAYNESKQESTGYPPFIMEYGQMPHTPMALIPSQPIASTESLDDFTSRMTSIIHQAQDSLKAAQDKQAHYANRHRRHHVFHPGDQVLLSGSFISNLPNTVQAHGAGRKLASKYWGPFEVEHVINGVAVRLKLPATWNIHPVIHVSHLIPWQDGSEYFPERQPPPPDPEIVDDEEHYLVEAFRAHRRRRGTLEYLVKWAGYPEEENCWRPAHELQEDMSSDAFQQILSSYHTYLNSRQLPNTTTPSAAAGRRSSTRHRAQRNVR
jgi:hypothetical protein